MLPEAEEERTRENGTGKEKAHHHAGLHAQVHQTTSDVDRGWSPSQKCKVRNWEKKRKKRKRMTEMDLTEPCTILLVSDWCWRSKSVEARESHARDQPRAQIHMHTHTHTHNCTQKVDRSLKHTKKRRSIRQSSDHFITKTKIDRSSIANLASSAVFSWTR